MPQRTSALIFLLVGFVLGFLIATGVGCSLTKGPVNVSPSSTGPACLGEECLEQSMHFPLSELSSVERITLTEDMLALQNNKIFYERTVQQFGSQHPFSLLLRSTQQDEVNLSGVFDKYGLPVPVHATSLKPLPPFGAVTTTCQSAIDQEIPTLEWQDKQKEMFTTRPDVLRWLDQRQRKIRTHVLPLLEACTASK